MLSVYIFMKEQQIQAILGALPKSWDKTNPTKSITKFAHASY